MLDAEAARARVQSYLDTPPRDARIEPVTTPDVQDLGDHWLVFWDDRRHLETGEFEYALAGNLPVAVAKTDGALSIYDDRRRDPLSPLPGWGPDIGSERARELAVEELRRQGDAAGEPVAFAGPSLGRPELVEAPDAYVFDWNSERYLASRDVVDQLLVGPIVVARDGSWVGVIGTAPGSLDRWRMLRSSGRV